VTPAPIRLVIFDCDGVLIDSEGPANRLCAAEISKLGWILTQEECQARFMGFRLSDMPPVIEAQLGHPVPTGWVQMLCTRLIEMLGHESVLMPGAREAIEAVMQLGLPFRIASNSSHEEMAVKFLRTGLTGLVQGRLHSARDVAAGKPAPDVFLAAAMAEGVAPAQCLVIEDSVPGVRAAVAAGMRVLGIDVHGDGAALRAVGARPIRAMSEVAGQVRLALRSAA